MNSGEGWYEWYPPDDTTSIAYIDEAGGFYSPEGYTPDEFTLSASRGRVHRLVRADGTGARQ